MALMSEDFQRCTNCDNNWFEPKVSVVMGKTSTVDEPVVVRTKTEYVCTLCIQVKYTKEEQVGG
jgi:hypothetical protein